MNVNAQTVICQANIERSLTDMCMYSYTIDVLYVQRAPVKHNLKHPDMYVYPQYDMGSPVGWDNMALLTSQSSV